MLVGPACEGLGDTLGVILFQMPPQPAWSVGGRERFAERLARFLGALPVGPVYAVELRTEKLLGERYAAALASAGAAHCFNVHPSMPDVALQAGLLDPAHMPALVVRWMLGGGQRYEDARERYRPFAALVDPDPDARARSPSCARRPRGAGSGAGWSPTTRRKARRRCRCSGSRQRSPIVLDAGGGVLSRGASTRHRRQQSGGRRGEQRAREGAGRIAAPTHRRPIASATSPSRAIHAPRDRSREPAAAIADAGAARRAHVRDGGSPPRASSARARGPDRPRGSARPV